MKFQKLYISLFVVALSASGGGGDDERDPPPVPLNTNFNGVVSGTSTMVTYTMPQSNGLCAAPNE